jgi:hypothetical protein
LIAAYSPQARGRSERMFATLQHRLPKEPVLARITPMSEANRFLTERIAPATTPTEATSALHGASETGIVVDGFDHICRWTAIWPATWPGSIRAGIPVARRFPNRQRLETRSPSATRAHRRS